MKKIKRICSAIAAFGMLALAGCDMEIPDSSKVNIISGLVISGQGNTTYGTMTAYSKAMIGDWSVTTYVDSELKTEDESCSGTEWWDSGNTGSTAQALADGSTVKIVATSESADGQIFFECTDGTNYISVNPYLDAWGTGVTYTSYATPSSNVGTVVTFTVTRKGDVVTFTAAAKEGN